MRHAFVRTHERKCQKMIKSDHKLSIFTAWLLHAHTSARYRHVPVYSRARATADRSRRRGCACRPETAPPSCCSCRWRPSSSPAAPARPSAAAPQGFRLPAASLVSTGVRVCVLIGLCTFVRACGACVISVCVGVCMCAALSYHQQRRHKASVRLLQRPAMFSVPLYACSYDRVRVLIITFDDAAE